MKCPRTTCSNKRLSTTKTLTQYTIPKLPEKYGTMNITYRQKKCPTCGYNFITLEVLVEDYVKYFDTAAIKTAGGM